MRTPAGTGLDVSGANIALVALGAVFLGSGVALILERQRVTDWNNRNSRRATGPGKRMTPGMMLVLGLVIAAMGGIILGLGLTVNAHSNPGGSAGPLISRLIGLVLALPFVIAVLVLRARDRRLHRNDRQPLRGQH